MSAAVSDKIVFILYFKMKALSVRPVTIQTWFKVSGETLF